MFEVISKRSKSSVDKRTNLFDKCFKDSSGRVVLAQVPNLPIIVWATMRVLSWLLSGTAKHIVQMIAFGALFTWAWLELFQGINYFRRTLGLVVLAIVILSSVYH